MSSTSNIKIEEIVSSFDSRGYKLTTENRVPFNISLEETIVLAIVSRNERLIEGIPVLLSVNKVDYRKLKKLIDRYKVWNEFGYLGNFSLRHICHEELKNLVQYCREKKKNRTNLSTLDSAFFKNSASKEQEEWNLIGAPSYPALEQQYRRCCR